PEPVAAPAEAPAAAGGGDDFDDLMAMLDDVGGAIPATAEVEGADDAAPAGPADWLVTFRPPANALDNGGEPLLLIRELTRMSARVLSCDAAALPPLAALDPETSYLAWQIALPGHVEEDDIRAVFEFTDGSAVTLARGEAAATEPAPPTIVVEEPVVAAPAPEPVAEAIADPVVTPAPAPVAETPVAAPAPVPAPAPSAVAATGRGPCHLYQTTAA
ncbi:hypothetical protein NS334_16375, partial [Sphingomonas endophytica]